MPTHDNAALQALLREKAEIEEKLRRVNIAIEVVCAIEKIPIPTAVGKDGETELPDHLRAVAPGEYAHYNDRARGGAAAAIREYLRKLGRPARIEAEVLPALQRGGFSPGLRILRVSVTRNTGPKQTFLAIGVSTRERRQGVDLDWVGLRGRSKHEDEYQRLRGTKASAATAS